ncbi:MAG: acyl-CoA reductase, partial [Bacteroidota bacterium]
MDNIQVSQLSPKQIQAISLFDLPIFNKSKYVIKPFDTIVIDFFDTVSKSILSNKSINSLPEIAALGFWLRKANLLKLKQENEHLFGNEIYNTSPLGKVFHICPANVDTMFIYSLTVSVLMGNKNLLRVSSRMDAPHVSMLFEIINNTIGQEKYSVFKDYINIISYPHSDAISTSISGNVNA